ncbi:hypothetical protein [Spirosoma areae]
MIHFLVLFIILANQLAYGQALNEQYGILSLGTSAYTLQDPTVSPMTYHGSLFSVGLGFEKRKSRSFTRWSLAGDVGKLHSANATKLRPMQSSVYRLDLLINYNRWLSDETARWRWFAGGAYRWHNSLRLTEQNDTGMISFLIANSLGATGGVERKLPLFGKLIRVNGMAELPLLSHVIRPSYLNLYNYIDPKNDLLQERLDDARLVTINRFPALVANLSLTCPIAGENQVRLGYEWAFYHYDRPFPANVGRHTVALQLVVRL